MKERTMKQNRLKQKRRLFLLLTACVLVLAQCDKKKDPLPGKRESLLIISQELAPSLALKKTSIVVSEPLKNDAWSQSSGNASHHMTHVSLPHTLKLKWANNSLSGSSQDQRLLSNSVTSSEAIFVMDSIGSLRAFDFQGKELWNINTSPPSHAQDALGGGIAYHNGIVFAATSFGDVKAYDAKSGKEQWSRHVISPMRIAPTVFNNHVYVVTVNNELICLDHKNGDVLWTHAGIAEPSCLLGGASPSVNDRAVVAVYSSGEVYALNPDNGHVLWSDTLTAPLRYDTVSNIAHIRARPIIYKDHVFIISHGGRMICLDFETGLRRYQRDIGGVRTPTLHNDVLYLLTNDNDLVAMDTASGDIFWTIRLPSMDKEKGAISYAGPILAGHTLVLSASNGSIVRIDPKKGTVLQEISSKGSFKLSPIVAQDHLIILSDEGEIRVYDA
jgi:outer membrane protein assembly factor BamB